jgi:hypothetical protein
LRKISAVGTFFVRLASTDRTSAHTWTASARLRSTVARSVANDRKQPSSRSVASDETIGVIVTASRGDCARNASVRSGQLRIEMPPRAKSPQNGVPCTRQLPSSARRTAASSSDSTSSASGVLRASVVLPAPLRPGNTTPISAWRSPQP